MNKFSWLAIALILSLTGMVSCLDGDDEPFNPFEQYKKDTTAIGVYVRSHSNGMIVLKDSSGIYLRIQTPGDRLPPALPSNQIVTSYVGKYFPDGGTFDQSAEYTTTLDVVIPGWTRAFQLLPQGSSADIFIPSAFAYGSSGQGPIPANSILQFHVELAQVKYTVIEKSKLTSDTTAIADYLADNQIEALRDTSGVLYEITQVGSGPTPSWYDKVIVSYSLSKFEGLGTASAAITPVKDFGTSTSISGYQRDRVIDYINGVKAILLKMNAGTKARLYIPSGMAYGKYDYYDLSTTGGTKLLSANANIVVDIELKQILE
jgi:FKBP-type peptidyl-prolyl cis-trans isomerase FkpA